jgi:aspartyl-tRNA synthetase
MEGYIKMEETIYGLKRTHGCAEIDIKNVGQEVTVMGWAHKRRDLGGVIFIDLRDRSGILQVVISSENDQDLFSKGETIRSEYVLAIVGDVVI